MRILWLGPRRPHLLGYIESIGDQVEQSEAAGYLVNVRGVSPSELASVLRMWSANPEELKRPSRIGMMMVDRSRAQRPLGGLMKASGIPDRV